MKHCTPTPLVIVCKSICHHAEYIDIPPIIPNGYGGLKMTTPSNLVSLRITEEDLALLDGRVGLEGTRNRSDVIRMAIQQYLKGQPLLSGMDSVRIPLGYGDKMLLGQLYELQGTTPETAAQEGLSLYIEQAIKSRSELTQQLEDLLVQAKSSTIRREEYHE